jgi:hypothetical protein
MLDNLVDDSEKGENCCLEKNLLDGILVRYESDDGSPSDNEETRNWMEVPPWPQMILLRNPRSSTKPVGSILNKFVDDLFINGSSSNRKLLFANDVDIMSEMKGADCSLPCCGELVDYEIKTRDWYNISYYDHDKTDKKEIQDLMNNATIKSEVDNYWPKEYYECKLENQTSFETLEKILRIKRIQYEKLANWSVNWSVVTKFEKEFPGSVKSTTLIWDKVMSWKLCSKGEKDCGGNFHKCMTLDECKDRCAHDPKCTSIMVGYDGRNDTEREDTSCVLLTNNYPYMVAVINKVRLKEFYASGSLDFNAASVRMEVKAPIYPRSYIYDEDAFWINASGYQHPDLVRGPVENASLSLAQCLTECVKDSACNTVAYPGCYLMDLADYSFGDNVKLKDQKFTATLSEKENEKNSMLMVKRSSNIEAEGLVGYPEVAAFQTDEEVVPPEMNRISLQNEASSARLAYLNRPTACAFDSEGSVILADTWNQRIRKVSSMYSDCHHHRELNTEDEIQAYVDLVKEVKDNCSMGDASSWYKDLESAVLGNDTTTAGASKVVQWEDFENFVCNYTSKMTAADAVEPPTRNLYVLCHVCKKIENPSGILCPSVEICNCRHGIQQLMSTSVYLNCPKSDAMFDNWHRLISAYAHCFWSSSIEDVRRWMQTDKAKEDLKDHIKNASKSIVLLVPSRAPSSAPTSPPTEAPTNATEAPTSTPTVAPNSASR